MTYQPAHALLSARLAAAWAGTRRFPRPSPWPELLVAVGQHDVGWIAWEQEAKIDDGSMPRNFTDLALDDHLRIWRRGVALASHQGRFVGLMVSRHATALYGHREDEAPEIADFLAEQRALQTSLLELLGYEEEAVAEAYRMVRLMDWFSLALCMGRYEEGDVDLGAGPGGVDLTLVPLSDDRLTVTPWPFAVDSIDATVEARRLERRTFADDADLQAALRHADVVERRWQIAHTDAHTDAHTE